MLINTFKSKLLDIIALLKTLGDIMNFKVLRSVLCRNYQHFLLIKNTFIKQFYKLMCTSCYREIVAVGL